MIPIKLKPTSPGEILREEFLVPLRITQKQLAHHIGCDLKVIDRIVNEKTQPTPKIAIKLAATFNTSADFWLNSQNALDLYQAGILGTDYELSASQSQRAQAVVGARWMNRSQNHGSGYHPPEKLVVCP